MPFRLINTPATCQALINNTLRQYLDDFVIAYLNDILIYSENEEDHVKHITAVLEALEEIGIKINNEKSIFYVKEIEYLGYILRSGSVSIDPKKMKTVRD